MNSRPLVPASSDPTEMHALSPNNFLNRGELLHPAAFTISRTQLPSLP